MELRENADCETVFGRLMTASSRAASPAPARPRSVGADLLRALAILLVMLWHLPKPATPALLGALKPYGWIGVDLFFVLSGYLIGTQLLTPLVRGERVNLRAFFVRRSFRILPAFLVVLCVYVFVPVTRETSAMEPAWRFLTFTMNFGLNFAENGTFSHAWSLCVEEHFYLILPLLLLGISWSAKTVRLVALAIILCGMILRFAIWENVVEAQINAGNYRDLGFFYLESIYYPTYCRLDGLLFGVLLAVAKLFEPELWRQYMNARIAGAAGAACVAASLALLAYRGALAPTKAHMPVLSMPGAVFAYPILAAGFTLILASLLDSEAVLNRWRIPGAAAMATLSYGLYLTHKSVIHLSMAY
jgi:peptidoglycan/LPS O-acetylase OafA/YrhL